MKQRGRGTRLSGVTLRSCQLLQNEGILWFDEESLFEICESQTELASCN